MALPLMTRREAISLAAIFLASASCRAAPSDHRSRLAPRQDLYHCEGCEGALERDPNSLSWRSRIAPSGEPGEKLTIEGRVFQADRKTPASNVVVYAYHTNAAGRYANGSNESEWSRRHGRLRAWAKTDAQGRYQFDTIKPAPYPTMTMPAHVHFTILEPGRRAYYIDDIVFDGEFSVTPEYRSKQELRGGSGIVTLQRNADRTWVARRDIVLESHP